MLATPAASAAASATTPSREAEALPEAEPLTSLVTLSSFGASVLLRIDLSDFAA